MLSREHAIRILEDGFQDNPEDVQEYIMEAEHQDGQEYWDQFQTPEELTEDFQMYLDVLYN